MKEKSLFNGAEQITISKVTALIQSETFHASTTDAGFDNLWYDGFTVVIDDTRDSSIAVGQSTLHRE